MSHHEYSIYIGGKKEKLPYKYCEDCKNTLSYGMIYSKKQHILQIKILKKQQKINVRSHKNHARK